MHKCFAALCAALILCFGSGAEAAKKQKKKRKPPAPITHVLTHVPEGADLRAPDARVIVYFFGWNTKEASGFKAKAEQVFVEFEGKNVIVFIPEIGSHPGKGGVNLPNILAKEYAALIRKTGVDVAKLPLIAIGFSGGAHFLSAYIRHGYQAEQLNKNGSVIFYLGGLYSSNASLAKKYSAAFVSISTDGDVPGSNRMLAFTLGVPMSTYIDDLEEIRPGEAVIANIPFDGIHNLLPSIGLIRKVFELTAPK